MILGTITTGSGWIVLTLVILSLLGMRYGDQIAAWWHRCNLVGRKVYIPRKELQQQIDWRDAWSRGKQVTFMEPEPSPSPVIKVDSKPAASSITSLYDSMTPRDQSRFKAGLPPYLLDQLRDYERSKELDARRYRYP